MRNAGDISRETDCFSTACTCRASTTAAACFQNVNCATDPPTTPAAGAARVSSSMVRFISKRSSHAPSEPSGNRSGPETASLPVNCARRTATVQSSHATAAAAAAIPITTVNIYVATASPPCRHRRRHTTRARDCNPASITVATQCGVAIRSKGGAAEPGTSRAFFCQTPSTASQSSGHPGSDYGDNTLVLSSLQGPLSIATQSAVACAFGQYQPYS